MPTNTAKLDKVVSRSTSIFVLFGQVLAGVTILAGIFTYPLLTRIKAAEDKLREVHSSVELKADSKTLEIYLQNLGEKVDKLDRKLDEINSYLLRGRGAPMGAGKVGPTRPPYNSSSRQTNTD